MVLVTFAQPVTLVRVAHYGCDCPLHHRQHQQDLQQHCSCVCVCTAHPVAIPASGPQVRAAVAAIRAAVRLGDAPPPRSSEIQTWPFANGPPLRIA